MRSLSFTSTLFFTNNFFTEDHQVSAISKLAREGIYDLLLKFHVREKVLNLTIISIKNESHY